jgi:hypothetical protein
LAEEFESSKPLRGADGLVGRFLSASTVSLLEGEGEILPDSILKLKAIQRA